MTQRKTNTITREDDKMSQRCVYWYGCREYDAGWCCYHMNFIVSDCVGCQAFSKFDANTAKAGANTCGNSGDNENDSTRKK